MPPFMERCAVCTRPAHSTHTWSPRTRGHIASTTDSTIAAAAPSTNPLRRGARSREPSITCSTGGAPPMPNSKQANDVATYAAAVRSALASLPDAERASLLEDLENHLAEVAGESDRSLQERLGKPEDYAAELRSAYSSGSNTPNVKRRWPIRERSWALVKAVFGTWAYRELRALLPELLPGWWVLRAYLIVLVLAFTFRGDSNLRPIPNPFSSGGLLQIVTTLVAIVISVRLGRRGMPVNRAWRGAGAASTVPGEAQPWPSTLGLPFWRYPSSCAWAPAAPTPIHMPIHPIRTSQPFRPATTPGSPTSIPIQRMARRSKTSFSTTRMDTH